jgi:hypothetical protein
VTRCVGMQLKARCAASRVAMPENIYRVNMGRSASIQAFPRSAWEQDNFVFSAIAPCIALPPASLQSFVPSW